MVFNYRRGFVILENGAHSLIVHGRLQYRILWKQLLLQHSGLDNQYIIRTQQRFLAWACGVGNITRYIVHNVVWCNLVPRAHVSFGQRQDTPCLGADQKKRGLWERDCVWCGWVITAHAYLLHNLSLKIQHHKHKHLFSSSTARSTLCCYISDRFSLLCSPRENLLSSVVRLLDRTYEWCLKSFLCSPWSPCS